MRFFVGSGAARTYTDQKIADLVDTAPATLNTLNELAAALNDDANYATTVVNALAAKADSSALTSHNSATTSVHGIADTSALETTTGAQAKATAAQTAAASYTNTAVASKANFSTVADEPALLASGASVGQLVYRQDTNKVYILLASPANTKGNWGEVVTEILGSGVISTQSVQQAVAASESPVISPLLLAGM